MKNVVPHTHLEGWISKINTGQGSSVLKQLNTHKAGSTAAGVDYCRALCFLHGEGNLFEARQAVLEELRLHPAFRPARELLYQLNGQLRPLLLPPEAIRQAQPHFYLLCDALLDYTMLSWGRLLKLYQSVHQLYAVDEVSSIPPGPIMECGSAGGGAAVLMAVASRLAEESFTKRTGIAIDSKKVLSFDTFTGMPEPSKEDNVKDPIMSLPAVNSSWSTGTCRGSEEVVHSLAANFNVQECLVTFPGRFEETLPQQSGLYTGGIALLHLDADWYHSVKYVLQKLTPVLHSPTETRRKKRVQIDDYYYWSGCKQAVDETMAEWHAKGLTVPPLEEVDGNAVFLEW